MMAYIEAFWLMYQPRLLRRSVATTLSSAASCPKPIPTVTNDSLTIHFLCTTAPCNHAASRHAASPVLVLGVLGLDALDDVGLDTDDDIADELEPEEPVLENDDVRTRSSWSSVTSLPPRRLTFTGALRSCCGIVCSWRTKHYFR